jgi:hypothetical protein
MSDNWIVAKCDATAEDALAPGPRMDDHAYRVATSARLRDTRTLERAVAELREAYAAFHPIRFAASLPYEHDSDRQALLDALAAAHLKGS